MFIWIEEQRKRLFAKDGTFKGKIFTFFYEYPLAGEFFFGREEGYLANEQ
jgi:hypothetical protein